MNYQTLILEIQKVYYEKGLDNKTFLNMIRALINSCNIKSKRDLKLLTELKVLLKNSKEFASLFPEESHSEVSHSEVSTIPTLQDIFKDLE